MFAARPVHRASAQLAAPAVKFGGDAVSVDDSTFQKEVLDVSKTQPVLVDFYAAWCPPCQQLMPRVETAATANLGKTKVVKYNVDPTNSHKIQIKGAARQYSVFKIPTLIMFKNGQPVERVVGAISQQQLDDLIARHP